MAVDNQKTEATSAAASDLDRFLARAKYKLNIGMENLKVTAQNPSVLLSAIPMVEKIRIDRALDEIASVPEGRMLVERARESGLPIHLNTHAEGRGGALIGYGKVEDGRGYERKPDLMHVQGYSTHATVVAQLAHELRHLQQTQEKTITGFEHRVLSPVEAIWHNRFIEADAEATATDIAWKLKQAGKPGAWEALKQGSNLSPQTADAYEKIAKSDPSAVADGRAKRAAFDEWFVATNRSGAKISDVYNVQSVKNYPDRGHLEKMANNGVPFGLDKETLLRLGKLDGPGKNYLDIPGAKPIDGPHYRSDMPSRKEVMHKLVTQQKEFNEVKSARAVAAQTAVKKADVAASKFAGKADVAVSIAEGNYASAAVAAASDGGTLEKTAQLASKIAPDLAKGALQVAKRAPVIGAVITAGYVAKEVGENLLDGKFGKAGAALAAGGAEIAGNTLGFGAGDAAREGVRAGVIAAAGEDYAVEKSGLRTLGERGSEVVRQKLDDQSAKQPTARNKPPSP